MDEKLLAMYLEHASTKDAMAILFVKKNMQQSAKKWVDIIDCEQYELSDNKLHFRFVEFGLYKRTIKPKYPPKSEFTKNGKFDQRSYYTAIRAITWETANRDINQQKGNCVVGDKYRITGVRYNKSKKAPPAEWVYKIKSTKRLNSAEEKRKAEQDCIAEQRRITEERPKIDEKRKAELKRIAEQKREDEEKRKESWIPLTWN